MELDPKERDLYRQKLEEKKREIIYKLSEFANETKEIGVGAAQDVVDRAESSYTKEFLLTLSDTERNQLVLIDKALRRLEKDEFGSCEQCRKAIGLKRLGALPWTSLCIDCQQKLEEESI